MNLTATKIRVLSIVALALLPVLSGGQTVVRSATADSTWNDTVIAPQCTLTATPTSISVGETSAVVIAGCGAPTNPANQYRWTVTNSGPTASGTGATYTFPTAGTFCYTVRGASVDGWGKVSPQACVTVTAVTVTATCPTPTSGTATCPSGGTYDYGTNYGPAPTCAVIPWDNYLTACQLTTTCVLPQVPNLTNTACICTNGGTGASCTLPLTCTLPQVPNLTNTACICTNGGTGPSCLITPNATMIATCYWDSTYSASCAHQTFTVTCDSGLDVSANYGSSSGSDLQWGVSATSTTRVIGIGCP
ncbi:MAG: hypothetical protein ING75_15965 [Rhodocyclaceae bacterium]|nr:hypothetical protein [Rhodocyclaceae bacterium]